MNCNVEILEPFKYGTSQGIADLKQGEVYPGTAADGGGVVFHATLPSGKIAPVILESNDGRIKLTFWKNQTSV